MELDPVFTVAWVALFLGAIVTEGVALANSKGGDTLSEHLWAWLGIRTATFKSYQSVVMPKWTLRVARTVFVSFIVWFTLHITTGWV